MNVLNLPRPGWMTEDLVLLEEQARRFIATEYVPHMDSWNEQGMYDREVWTKAGAAGLLCPAIPEEYGGAGGSFAHEAVIGRELSLAGSTPLARRCIPASSRLTSSTTAARSKNAAGCQSSLPASSSGRSP